MRDDRDFSRRRASCRCRLLRDQTAGCAGVDGTSRTARSSMVRRQTAILAMPPDRKLRPPAGVCRRGNAELNRLPAPGRGPAPNGTGSANDRSSARRPPHAGRARRKHPADIAETASPKPGRRQGRSRRKPQEPKRRQRLEPIGQSNDGTIWQQPEQRVQGSLSALPLMAERIHYAQHECIVIYKSSPLSRHASDIRTSLVPVPAMTLAF